VNTFRSQASRNFAGVPRGVAKLCTLICVSLRQSANRAQSY
jgi:hypothetical protein